MAETLDTHYYKDLLRATHEQAKNIAVIAFIIETNDVCGLIEHSNNGDKSERDQHSCRERLCAVASVLLL